MDDCENLAYFQSIENNSKLSMTKIYLGKRQIGSIKLALLPWLQIYHDNIENRRESSDSLMDVYTVTLMASITCWLYKTYVGKVSPFSVFYLGSLHMGGFVPPVWGEDKSMGTKR